MGLLKRDETMGDIAVKPLNKIWHNYLKVKTVKAGKVLHGQAIS